MILGLKIQCSLVIFGMFFITFPIIAWIVFKISFLMDEYTRIGFMAFVFLGASMGIGFTMLFHEKFTKEDDRKRVTI